VTELELKAIADGFAPVVRAQIAAATEPLLARIAELEQRPIVPGRDGRDGLSVKGDAGEPGRDGKDVDPDVIRRMVADEVAKIPAPVNGKDAAEPDLDAIALKAAELVPPGKDGADGKDAVIDLDQVAQKAAALVAPGKDGRDGKDVDSDAVNALVADAVKAIHVPDVEAIVMATVHKAIETIERPKDGQNGRDGKDADPEIIKAEVARAVAAVPAPKDGRDGLPGRDGKDGIGQKGVDGINGQDGKDGRDGLGLDDLDVLYDGERTFTFKWAAGDRSAEKSFVVPVLIYRDVYAEGKTYQAGDVVTWGGGMFVAKAETSAKPGLPSEDSRAWKLCVKAGRDGKAGK
jgi:hypothetical protein